MDKKKNPKKDFSELAFSIVQQVTEEDKPKVISSNKGRAGGLKGGDARAKTLTLEQRSEIARTAAIARWKKTEKKD